LVRKRHASVFDLYVIAELMHPASQSRRTTLSRRSRHEENSARPAQRPQGASSTAYPDRQPIERRSDSLRKFGLEIRMAILMREVCEERPRRADRARRFHCFGDTEMRR